MSICPCANYTVIPAKIVARLTSGGRMTSPMSDMRGSALHCNRKQPRKPQ